MSDRRLVLAIGLAVVLGLVPGLRAEPLDLKQVPADAKWVGHVDFDAMRASTVVQKAVAKHMERHKDAEKHLAMAKLVLGMDLMKDLHGLTVYGKEIGKPTGVMLFHARMDQKRLEALASKVPNRKVTRSGQRDIATWTHKHHGKEHTVASTFFKPDLLVLASSVEELRAALVLLDGKGTGVGSDSPLAGRVPPGTIALFRVAGVAAAKLPCKSPVVKQLDSYRFVIGENEGQSFYRARAIMTGSELVEQLKTVIEGGRALALIHNQGGEQGKKLINGLKVNADGKTLTVLWSGSANDVWDQVQLHAKIFIEKRAEFMKKRAEMMKKRGEMKKGGCCPGCCPFGGTEKKGPEKKGPDKKPIRPEDDF